MYANRSLLAGTPTTAEAVSCEPTATTDVPSKTPIVSPGCRIAGKSEGRRPSSWISGSDQSRVRTSTSSVVDALVYSAPASPVSQ
jgi:hypothetical protein